MNREARPFSSFNAAGLLFESGKSTMNTPKKSKQPKRWKPAHRVPAQGSADGYFGIADPTLAASFGWLITYWTHVEEMMIGVFEELITGDAFHENHAVSLSTREIFRSITSQQTRIKIMRKLLEESSHNASKSQMYDEIIEEYYALNRIRNSDVHGLWMWNHQRNRLSIWEPSVEMMHDVEPRTVTLTELNSMMERMRALMDRIRLRFA